MLVRSVGMRGARALLQGQCNARTWQRIRKDLQGMDAASDMKYAAIRHVQQALTEAKPLRLKEFAVGRKAL